MRRKAAIKAQKESSDIFKESHLAHPIFGDASALKKVADRIANGGGK
ncbi:MAG: hypothetical protein Q8O19_00755 [Rectinemataceae bacterium]|nr:hypothetical protein [Rectinemataceae bacterium]